MAILTPEQVQTAKESVAQIFFSMTGRAPEFAALDHYYREYVRFLDERSDDPNAHELALTELSAHVYGPAVDNGEIPPVDGVFGHADFVSWVYNNVLSREPDEAGLKYYTDKLDAGATRLTDLIREVIAGAEGDERDSAIIANRTAVALEYAKWENSNPAMLKADPSLAVYSLADITEDPATAEAALAELRGEVVPDGNTYALTAGIDTIDGTELADVFNAHTLTDSGANITTLNEEDVIDGGDGIDTLNLTAKSGHNDELVGTVRNIEIINIKGSDNIGEALTPEQLGRIADARFELDSARSALNTARDGLNNAQNDLAAAQSSANSLNEQIQNFVVASDAVTVPLAKTAIQNLFNAIQETPDGLAAAVQAGIESIVVGDYQFYDNDTNTWVSYPDIGEPGNGAGWEEFIESYVTAVELAIERSLQNAVAVYQDAVVDALDTHTNAFEEFQDELEDFRETLTQIYFESGRGTVDASFFEGSTAISVDGSFTHIDNITDQTITLTGEDNFSFNGDDANYNTLSYEAGVKQATVNVQADGTILLNGADLESVSIEGAVTPSGTLTVLQGDATSIESLSLSISNNFGLEVDTLTDLVHLDLSGSTGNVGAPNNLVDLTGLDLLQTYKGSQGADYVRIDIDEDQDVDADIDRVIDLGAGNDRLTLNVTSPPPETDDDDSLTITLGAGNDQVNVVGVLANVAIEGGAINNLITITDFNGAEDVLTFSVSAIDFDDRDILTNVESADIAAAKSLFAALEAAQGYTEVGTFSTFVYDGATYIYSNNADSDSLDGDGLIELVGFTGQLNDHNFVQESFT